MDPLTVLARLDRIYAAVTAAIGLAAMGGLLGALWWIDPPDPAVRWTCIGLSGFILVAAAGMGALLLLAARGVAAGRSRGVQTALGLMSLASNPPLGTAFGLFSLWICWVHPGARARFAGRPAPPPDPVLDARLRSYERLARRLVIGGGVVYVLLSAGIMGGLGAVLSWGQQETGVRITDEEIELDGMYGETVDREDITAVELRGGLPTITLRTNGYALGGTRKGWFSTREYGEIKLLVSSDAGPFLYIERDGGWLIYAAADPERTRAVYEALREGSPGP